MKASAGTVEWDGATRIKELRQASAVVDAPGVNNPSSTSSVRDLVTEDLALIPRRFRGALLSTPWLKVNRFEDIAGRWVEDLSADRRLELPDSPGPRQPAHPHLLVVDSPDRHSAIRQTGCRGLQDWPTTAGGGSSSSPHRGAVPPGWTGPVVDIGNAAPAPAATGTPEAPEATPAPAATFTSKPKTPDDRVAAGPLRTQAITAACCRN